MSNYFPTDVTPESQATGLTLLLIKYTGNFAFPAHFLIVTFLLFQRNYLQKSHASDYNYPHSMPLSDLDH